MLSSEGIAMPSSLSLSRRRSSCRRRRRSSSSSRSSRSTGSLYSDAEFDKLAQRFSDGRLRLRSDDFGASLGKHLLLTPGRQHGDAESVHVGTRVASWLKCGAEASPIGLRQVAAVDE